MGFEYPVTITLGIRGQTSVDLLESVEVLEKRGLFVIPTDRGGKATIHSPGQLVIYPILPLKNWGLGVKDYVDFLMETTSIWLSNYGVDVKSCKGYPGLFSKKGKIVFIGVSVRKGVCFHGLSINVVNDLSLFSAIRVCGESEMNLDSIYPYPQSVELEPLFQQWCDCFSHKLKSLSLLTNRD